MVHIMRRCATAALLALAIISCSALAVAATAGMAQATIPQKTYMQDPIPEPYSCGTINLTGGKTSTSGASGATYVAPGSTEVFDVFTNTSRSASVYHRFDSCAWMGTQALDVVVYTWGNGRYRVSRSQFSAWCGNGSTEPQPGDADTIYEEYRFYKHGTSTEVAFQGTMIVNCMEDGFKPRVSVNGATGAWLAAGSCVTVDSNGVAQTIAGTSVADPVGDARARVVYSVSSSASNPLRVTLGRYASSTRNQGHAVMGYSRAVSYNIASNSSQLANRRVLLTYVVEYGRYTGTDPHQAISYHAFSGWFSDPACTSKYAGTNMVTSDITLWGRYSEYTYKISHKANGGTGSVSDRTVRYSQSTTLASSEFKRAGYRLLGWARSATATKAEYAPGASVSKLSGTNGGIVTLHAVWEALPYSISYAANGGTGTMASDESVTDADYTVRACAFTRPGYRFDHWQLSTDGSSVAPGAVGKNLAGIGNPSCTLKAIWEPLPYTVLYDANGGTGTMASDESVTDADYTVRSCAFKRTGYLFSGWELSTDGSIVMPDEVRTNLAGIGNPSCTLKAIWEPITYTIAFHANGGSGSKMEDLACTYDEVAKLPTCMYAKTGYGFQGWSTSADGAIAFENGALVLNLTARDGDVVDLYAIWDEDAPVCVTYVAHEPDHASLTRDHEDLAPDTGQAMGCVASPAVGYVFKEWTDVEGAVVSDVAQVSPTRSENGLWRTQELIAHVRPATYAVFFDANGGEGAPDAIEASYDVPFAIPEQTPSHGTREFLGWADDEGALTFQPGDGAINLTEEDGAQITYHALWGPERFTVTFTDGMGGVLEEMVVAEGDDATAPDDPARPGCVFKGWSAPATQIHEDTVVDALWQRIACTVTFTDGMGGILEAKEVFWGDPCAPPIDPARPSHAFAGWTEIPASIVEDVTVDATWTPIVHKVTYWDGFGGIIGEHEVLDGQPCDPPKDPDMPGHLFLGWAGMPERVQGDVNVEALWEPILHTVTFTDGHGGIIATVTAQHGGSALPPADPEAAGMRFVGWDAEATDVRGDMVINARWITVSEGADPARAGARILATRGLPQTGDGLGLTVLSLALIGGIAAAGAVIFRKRMHDEKEGE